MSYRFITLFSWGLMCWLPMKAQITASFNTELLSIISFPEENSDIWGFEKNGIHYAIIGNKTKTSIFSLEDPKKPILRYQGLGASSIWRDVKSYGNFIYVTADQGSDGIIIIDMSLAPNNISQTNFRPLVTLGTSVNAELQRCHNLYIDNKGFMYLAGCNISRRGVLIYDIKKDPKNPELLGAADINYSHDAYVRGDTLYSSELSFGLGIYDIKDRTKPVLLASQLTSRNFTHNAWVSDDGKYAFTTDEKSNAYLDAYDISDLNNIKFLDKFRPFERENDGVIPHNTHYINGYLVTSWYTDGIRIVDAHKPDNMVEVAYYDTWEDQNVCHNGFSGCWGAFVYTGSDIIYGSDINNGLFILKVNYKRASYLEGKILDSNGGAISGAKVEIESSQLNIKYSAPSGEYKTGIAESGNFTVKISHPEYITTYKIVNLKAGEITDVNFVLEKRIPTNVEIKIVDNKDKAIQADMTFRDGETSFDIKSPLDLTSKVSIPSGNYDVFINKWGYKNVFLPDVKIQSGVSSKIEQVLSTAFSDDFQFDNGWIVVNNGITSGAWVRAMPRGTEDGLGQKVNPDRDSDGVGGRAFVTGNGLPGANCNDVDNGTTELISPFMDLTSFQNPILSYSAWFYAGLGNSLPNDTMYIKMSNGQTEVILDKLFKNTNGWAKSGNYELKKLLPITSNMRLKVSISDQSGSLAHVVEGGFDSFSIVDGTISSISEDVKLPAISVYPSIAHDKIQVRFDDKILHENSMYQIIDMTGKIILTGTLQIENQTIDIESLNAGMYFMQVDGYKAQKFSVH